MRAPEPAVSDAGGNEAVGSGTDSTIDALFEKLEGRLLELVPLETASTKSRADLAELLDARAAEFAAGEGIELSSAERRELGTALLNTYMELHGSAMRDDPLSLVDQAKRNLEKASTNTVNSAKELIHPQLLEHIDASAATELARHELAEEISDVVGELLVKNKISLNSKEQRDLVSLLLNDMLGLGPLEPLLADESVTDIMVNGANQVWVERGGKLVLTDVRFRDEQHLLNIATRIVTAVGRRVDESQPICDARLADGSRVNVIIPPLAIDGASISIRKFSKKKITLDKMVETRNLSDAMCKVLKIAGRCRLNILISGGTGSGKTTMLNAISRMIDEGERTVTIEDAAELQLQQPHVVRLETRPPNLEGHGEITMRDLVKNALRMRPDRIILGEIRGAEAIDMLQAMNTGHDGSLGTIHANRPREALTRLENMVNMAGMNLPAKAIRTQIADALDMIVQVARMRDGVRRVQYITEVVGLEQETVVMQDIYRYIQDGIDEHGRAY
ncbi:MAG: CpaF family protein, partial [Alphaproteobacteria bacterium]